VFSPSRAAGAFDLGSYSRGQSRSVTMRERGEVLVLCNIGDETGPLATAALGQAPWRVVAGEPRETALAPVRQLQRMLLGIGVGMLLLAVAVGSRFVGGFVGAIQRLTHSAEIMASGDLSQPVTREDRHRELATLGSTFERMRTELRDSHAALTQRLAEREELMRLKEEFLANISHELRTPLNVIFGYTDMLSSDEDDPERRDALDRIRAQSEQLVQLVRDLMTLSGLNAWKIAVELCPVNVDELIGRIRALAEQLARRRSIAAVFEVPASVPALHTDPLRLEQILSNLVTNAFKFTTEGRVTVRVRYPTRDGQVLFEVADTGIGIAERELAHIFDEFRQVDGSMSRAHGGMGLGLALMRRLVGLLGGEVSVVSRLGEGSTFTVVLPVHHPGSDTLSPGQAA
jgi:signal transduction histidine kinase